MVCSLNIYDEYKNVADISEYLRLDSKRYDAEITEGEGNEG